MKRIRVALLLVLVWTTGCDDPQSEGTQPNVGGGGGAAGTKVATGGSATSNSGAGGSAGNSDSAGAGGADQRDENCTSYAPVQFEFTVQEPNSYCRASIDGVKVRILDGEREVATINDDRCQRNSCSACLSTVGCVGIVPFQYEADGTPYAAKWFGETYVASTCGDAETACKIRQCVPAGAYTAEYCIAPKGDHATCVVSGQENFYPKTACVRVPFTYPTSEVVKGTVASVDG